MNELPNILKNPFDPIYKLKDHEIYSLKECNELVSIDKYSYALFALWTSVVINLQRRIEFFGIENFLNIVEKKESFNEDAHNLKDRWLNINEFKIIEYSKKLNLINHVTQNLLNTLYWMKSNTNESENKELNKEEVLAVVYLIEKNLFLKPFKEDLRGKDPSIKNTKMKFRRKNDVKTDTNEVPNTYHNLILRSGVKVFEDNTKPNNPNNNLLDKYC